VYNDRGIAYANKEDYAHARADWIEALRLNPDDTQARINLERLQRIGY
jgi:Flp pilus assembly protein TadD